MTTTLDRLVQKTILESDLPKQVHTLWGLDDENLVRFEAPVHYAGPLYEVTVEDGQGNRYTDWVAAANPKEALDKLANAVEAWFRDRSRMRPNLVKARANRQLIAEHQLNDSEILRLGDKHLAFVDCQVHSLLFRFGWELPKNWVFTLPLRKARQ